MHTTTQTTLFDTLCVQLHVEPDRKGEVWIDCPRCGKDRKHFSFSAEHGAHCFSCDYSGSLAQVAELLSIAPDDRARPARRAVQPQAPRSWQQRPDYYLDRYCGALDRVTCWQAYKPLSLDSIARYRLGVGVLPSSRCTHRRLILPIFDGGHVVAFHGRAYVEGDTEAKWLTAGGGSKQVLFNADRLQPGATVAIVENFIDAILAMQTYPDVTAVAGGGVGWRDEWTAQIVASRPRHVLILLDNDLAGFPNAETYAVLSAQWQRERPGKPLPEPRGPKIARALLAAGVRSVRGPNWPRGTPPKHDIGADLMRGGMSS